MQTKTTNGDTHLRNSELDEELAGILTAISVVSKRLARKLLNLEQTKEHMERGGLEYGENE
ncbi:MAG: hypothetical protein ACOYJ1_12095 [Peptococcales bacterium]|jgi:hypothetical protein